MNYIKKENLIKGQQYKCSARNFIIGTWNGESFDYMREKWRSVFPDSENHWNDGAPYGTVKPLEIVKNDK